MMSRPLEFLSSASRAERRALLAGTLGWALDGMDVTLYAMVIATLMQSLRLSAAEAGLLASVTLVASALGGFLFGILADRAGRRKALMLSILVYSVFTAACGLARNVHELALFRFFLGLGMGGEWATGAALVAETWRAEHRGKALGLMQSGFAVGYALAALGLARGFLCRNPACASDPVDSPGVEESPLWHGKQQTTRSEPAPARKSFLASHGRILLLTLAMNSAALFAWWGLFTWIPSYLALPAAQGGRAMTLASSSLWIVVMQAGMWLGYVTFGFLGDCWGGKRSYVGYLLLAALLVPLYAHAEAAWSLFLLGPLLAFFGTGHFTGFGLIAAELFPTPFRATAMGLVYNFGRILSAVAPWLMGRMAGQAGIGSAFWICGLGYLLAGLLALLLPETRGRELA